MTDIDIDKEFKLIEKMVKIANMLGIPPSEMTVLRDRVLELLAIDAANHGCSNQSNILDGDLLLDDGSPYKFFSHLRGKKLTPWNKDLAEKEYTELELVIEALRVSGKSYMELAKDGILQRAKEEISLAKKREYDDTNGMGSVETRLQKAFHELSQEWNSGRYQPRNGRLRISAVATRAIVNLDTAKKWALKHRPELLS